MLTLDDAIEALTGKKLRLMQHIRKEKMSFWRDVCYAAAGRLFKGDSTTWESDRSVLELSAFKITGNTWFSNERGISVTTRLFQLPKSRTTNLMWSIW